MPRRNTRKKNTSSPHGKSRKKYPTVFIKKRTHGGSDPDTLLHGVTLYANQHGIYYSNAFTSFNSVNTSTKSTTPNAFLGVANTTQNATEEKALTELNTMLKNIQLPKVVNELRYVDEKKWMDTSFKPDDANKPFCIKTCNYKTRLFYPETTDFFDKLHNAFYVWYTITERIYQTNNAQHIANVRTIVENKTKNDFNNIQLELEKTRKKAKNAFVNTAMKLALQIHDYASKNTIVDTPTTRPDPTKALDITTKALQDIRTMLDGTTNELVSNKAFTIVLNGFRAVKTNDAVNKGSAVSDGTAITTGYMKTLNDAVFKLYSAEIKRKLSANAEPKYTELYNFSETIFGLKEERFKPAFKQFLFLVFIQHITMNSLTNVEQTNEQNTRWKMLTEDASQNDSTPKSYINNPMLTTDAIVKGADMNYITTNTDIPSNKAQYAIDKKDVPYMLNALLDFVSQFSTVNATSLNSTIQPQMVGIRGSMFLFEEAIKTAIQNVEKEAYSIIRASFGSVNTTNADNATKIMNMLFGHIHKPQDGNQKTTITNTLLKMKDNLEGEDARNEILRQIESISIAKSANPKTTIFQETRDKIKTAIETYEPVSDFNTNNIKAILSDNSNAEAIVNILFNGISTTHKIKAIQYAINAIEPSNVSNTNRQNIISAITKLKTQNILDENEASRMIKKLPFAVAPVNYNMTTIQSLLLPSPAIIDDIAKRDLVDIRQSVMKSLTDMTPPEEELFGIFNGITNLNQIKMQTTKMTDKSIRASIKTGAMKYIYKASTIHNKIRTYLSQLPYAVLNALFKGIHHSQRPFIQTAIGSIPNDTTDENAKLAIINAIKSITNIPEPIRADIVATIHSIPVMQSNYDIQKIKEFIYRYNVTPNLNNTVKDAKQIVATLFKGIYDADKIVYIMKSIYDGDIETGTKLERITHDYLGPKQIKDDAFKSNIQAINSKHQYSIFDNDNIINYIKDAIPEIALQTANTIAATLINVASNIAIASLYMDDANIDVNALPAKVNDVLLDCQIQVKTKLTEIYNNTALAKLRRNANTEPIRKVIDEAKQETVKIIQKCEYVVEYLKTNASNVFDKEQLQTVLDVTQGISIIAKTALEDPNVKSHLYPNISDTKNKDFNQTYRAGIEKYKAIEKIANSMQPVIQEYEKIQETASKIMKRIYEKNEQSKVPNIVEQLELIQSEKLVSDKAGTSSEINIPTATTSADFTELTKDLQSHNAKPEISRVLPFMLQVYESLYQDGNYNGTTTVQNKPIQNKVLMQYVIDKIREIERSHPRPDLFNTVYYFWNMFDLSVAIQYIQAYVSEVPGNIANKDQHKKINDRVVTRIEKQLGNVPTFELWDKKKEKTETDYNVFSVVNRNNANVVHKAESDILAMSSFPASYNALYQKSEVNNVANPTTGELQSQVAR